MNLDDVIETMFASMSYELGELPNWEAQAAIFSDDARLVRVNDDGVFQFNPFTFRLDLERMIASGALPSFWEGELSRHVHELDDFAQVLTIYEMKTSRDGDVLGRAIKSIQLFKLAGHWKISAMLWRREGTTVRIGTEIRCAEHSS